MLSLFRKLQNFACQKISILFYLSSLFLVWKWNETNNEIAVKESTTNLLAKNISNYPEKVILQSETTSPPESTRELHQIMAKQYDVPHGLHQGKPYKKILYWNSAETLPFSRKNNNFGLGIGRDRYKAAGCPVWQCETSEDRSNLSQYDAIIFSQRTFNYLDLPKERSPHQRYIFFSIESAAYPSTTFQPETITYTTMARFFNWTMTYRWDSDVVHPYGWIEPINSSIPLHPTSEEYKNLLKDSLGVNYADGKTKTAAFFATNCISKSGREELVNSLKIYISVDHYGDCGNLKCGTNYGNLNHTFEDIEASEEESCLKKVAKEYKFFLAFHNSLCLDYIAERFYNAIRFPIIPVVMDPHGSHAKVAPLHSFINVLDFPSIRDLADYLIKLDKNDAMYNEYFWWKKHHKVRNGMLYSGLHYRTYCSLCAALHNPSHRSDIQVYWNMKTWWNDKSECKTLKFDGIYVSTNLI